MKTNAIIAGVGMTRFAKHPDKGLKALGAEAVRAALADAGIGADEIQAAWVGNAAAGLLTGQESIRGQVILRSMGIGRIPVINVENACGSGATALHQACAMVTAGYYDVVLALGVEKLYHEDRSRTYKALSGGGDVEEPPFLPMEFYADMARRYMERYGLTREQLAGVSAKNSLHGSLNPRAQFRERLTVEDVLAAPVIVEPLTRPMCSPIGDGAAAVVLVSERKARQLDLGQPVSVVASVLHSGWDHGPDEPDAAGLCAREAYEDAGVGPEDLHVVELHDASAIGELSAYESLGLCPKGEAGKLIEEGTTRLGGRVPVNTSGGLLRKGHPVGATGIAQIVELTEQLQGRCGERQVEGATVALAHNGGGILGRGDARDAAAMCVTILVR